MPTSSTYTGARSPSTTPIEARRTSTSSQGRPSPSRQVSNQKRSSRPASATERPGATPLQTPGRSDTNSAVYGSYRNAARQQARTPSFARPPLARQLSSASSQDSASYSRSRRASVNRISGPAPPAYELVYQDLLKISNKPQSSAAFDKGKEINLRDLAPYTKLFEYATWGQMLAFGKLTLLSSSKAPSHYSLYKSDMYPAKKFLLTPDTQCFPYLKPIQLSVNELGHPVHPDNCTGLEGPTCACSDDLLYKGILVFFNCDIVLNKEKLRNKPQEIEPVIDSPRNINIFMTGYMRGEWDEDYDISSHPKPHRKAYDDEEQPVDKFTWGVNVVTPERRLWPQLQAQQSQNETLVCFEGLTDTYAPRCQAWEIRRIVAMA